MDEWVRYRLAGKALTSLVHVKLLPVTRYSARSLVWWPVSAAYRMNVTYCGVVLTVLRGGISWRDTRYPLAQLKAAPDRVAFGELDASEGGTQ